MSLNADRLLTGLALAWLAWLAVLVLPLPHLWDDLGFFVDAPPLSLGEGLRVAFTEGFWALADAPETGAMYRPLVGTTYVLERAVGAPAWLGHLINLLLLAGTAAGVATLARRLGGDAALAGLFTLCHPFAFELVGIVTNRTDLLAGLLVVGSLLVRGERRGDALGGVLLFLALLAKEVAFVGVALHLVHDHAAGRVELRRLLPGLLATATALALRALVLQGVAGDRGPADLLGAAASTGWTFLDVYAPIPAGPWPAPRAPASGLVLLALGLGVAALTRRALPFVWIALAWAPMAGWTGLLVRPSRGIAWLAVLGAALGAALLVARLPPRARPLVAAVVAVLFALGQATQAPHFRDEVALWTWAIAENPDAAMPRVSLGGAQFRAGNAAEGEASLRAAAGLAAQNREAGPFVLAATALGHLARDRGDLAAARAYYSDAVSVAGPERAGEAASALAGLPASP